MHTHIKQPRPTPHAHARAYGARSQIQQAELDKQSDAVLTERSVGGDLRREALKAANEQAMVDARVDDTRTQHGRLTAERDELQQELALMAQGQQGMDPETRTLQAAAAEVQREIGQRTAEIEQLAFQKAEKEKRLSEAGQRLSEAQGEERLLQQQLVTCSAVPLRISKQAAMVAAAVKTAGSSLQRENGLIAQLAAEQASMAASCAQLAAQTEAADERATTVSEALSAREKTLAELHSRLAAQRQQQVQASGDRAMFDAEVRRVFAEIRAAKELVAQEDRVKNMGLRALKQLEVRGQHTREQLQQEQQRQQENDLQATATRREAAAFAEALPRAEADLEAAQRQWEAGMGHGSEAVLAVQRVAAEVRELTGELARLQTEGRALGEYLPPVPAPSHWPAARRVLSLACNDCRAIAGLQ